MTWLFPNPKSVRKLILKHGQAKIKNKISLTGNTVIEEHLGKFGVISMEDLFHKIAFPGKNFQKSLGFLCPFHLLVAPNWVGFLKVSFTRLWRWAYPSAHPADELNPKYLTIQGIGSMWLVFFFNSSIFKEDICHYIFQNLKERVMEKVVIFLAGSSHHSLIPKEKSSGFSTLATAVISEISKGLMTWKRGPAWSHLPSRGLMSMNRYPNPSMNTRQQWTKPRGILEPGGY